MLTSADVSNLSNAATYIHDTELLLIDIATELGAVVSPNSDVYDSLTVVLSGLQADLQKTYKRVTSLCCDEEYVAY